MAEEQVFQYQPEYRHKLIASLLHHYDDVRDVITPDKFNLKEECEFTEFVHSFHKEYSRVPDYADTCHAFDDEISKVDEDGKPSLHKQFIDGIYSLPKETLDYALDNIIAYDRENESISAANKFFDRLNSSEHASDEAIQEFINELEVIKSKSKDGISKDVWDEQMVSVADLRDKPKDTTEPLIKSLFRSGMAVLFAPPKSMKSMVLQDLCIHLVTGGKFMKGDGFPGFQCRKVESVLYLDMDNGKETMEERWKALGEAYGWPKEMANITSISFPKPTFKSDDETSVQALIDTIKRHDVEVVVIETLLRTSSAKNENDPSMDLVMENLRRLKEEGFADIIVTHHTPRNADRLRGHDSIDGGVDIAIGIRRTDEIGTEIELYCKMTRHKPFTPFLAEFIYESDEDDDLKSCHFVGLEFTEHKAASRASSKTLPEQAYEIAKENLLELMKSDSIADAGRLIDELLGKNNYGTGAIKRLRKEGVLDPPIDPNHKGRVTKTLTPGKYCPGDTNDEYIAWTLRQTKGVLDK